MSEQELKKEEEIPTIPEGSKVIIPPEKITEKKKKERTQKQIEAFEKMRAKRLENDAKRKMSKEEKQKEIDNIKIQQDQEEEEERKRIADELKEKLGVDVSLLKKRGRKPGQHIPYKKEKEEKEEEKAEVKNIAPNVQNVQNVQNVVNNAPIGSRAEQAPPSYSNPYMAMLLSKMRR